MAPPAPRDGGTPPRGGELVRALLYSPPLQSTAFPNVEDLKMGILAWIILGLIAGAIAKAIMPGRDPGGFIVTALIGIVGAVIGGFLGNLLFGIGGVSGVDIRSILIAVVGALVLLWIYRLATRRSAV